MSSSDSGIPVTTQRETDEQLLRAMAAANGGNLVRGADGILRLTYDPISGQ